MIWWYVEIFTYQTTLHINNKKPPQSASESLRCINTPQIRVIPAGLQQTMILISVFCMKASLWRSFHPSPVRIFVPCPLHDSMLPWNPCTLAPPNSKPPQWVDRANSATRGWLFRRGQARRPGNHQNMELFMGKPWEFHGQIPCKWHFHGENHRCHGEIRNCLFDFQKGRHNYPNTLLFLLVFWLIYTYNIHTDPLYIYYLYIYIYIYIYYIYIYIIYIIIITCTYTRLTRW